MYAGQVLPVILTNRKSSVSIVQTRRADRACRVSTQKERITIAAQLVSFGLS